jgi:tRNA(fMet)-specific endonuclease VapC
VTVLHMLDTDTASYIIKGRSPAVATRLAEVPPSMLCISVMTRAELLYGLKRLPAGHRLHLGVQRFLRIVRALSWDADAITSPFAISWLQLANSAGAVLVTNNTQHHARIEPPLAIVDWAAET